MELFLGEFFLGEFFMIYLILMAASAYVGFKIASYVRSVERRMDDIEEELHTRIERECECLRQEINQMDMNSKPTSKS